MATAHKDFCLRRMRNVDIARILQIERQSFAEPRLKALGSFGAQGMVAFDRRHNTLAGYLVYVVGVNYFEVVSLAVAPEYRFQRIGPELMQWLMAKQTERRAVLSVEVDHENEPAKKMLGNLGFQAPPPVPEPFEQPPRVLFVLEKPYECEGV